MTSFNLLFREGTIDLIHLLLLHTKFLSPFHCCFIMCSFSYVPFCPTPNFPIGDWNGQVCTWQCVVLNAPTCWLPCCLLLAADFSVIFPHFLKRVPL